MKKILLALFALSISAFPLNSAVEPPVALQAGTVYIEPRVDASSPIPYTSAISPDDAFTLNSRPGSLRTIYLDFDGETVSGTGWNNISELGTGSTIIANPFDIDGDSSSFSTLERQIIIQSWLAVVEDYSIYDVNITTQDPGLEALERSSFSDNIYGTRALITDFDNPIADNCECGGIAFIGVFDEVFSTDYQPAWVFVENVQNGKIIAEIASHEVGHNLGLLHHGQGDDEYYLGANGWAPIMGAGYYEPVSTWSNGQYSNSTRRQDDLDTMTYYGLNLLTDDFGNTAQTATQIRNGIATQGLINSRSDVDYFKVEIADSALEVEVNVAEFSPNLDVQIDLFDETGVLRASANPVFVKVTDETANGLDATLNVDLPAGIYYIRLDGVGTTAYSDYGSVGQYAIKATYKVFTAGVPQISGMNKVNATLNALTGNWSPTPATFAYQWFADGSAITGATSPTFVVPANYNNTALSVQVTATNQLGESESATSSALVIQSNPVAPRLSVKRASNKLQLSWNAAEGDGATILRYEYQFKAGKKKWSSWKSVNLRQKASVAKIQTRTKYQLRVRAVTEIGNVVSNKVTTRVP